MSGKKLRLKKVELTCSSCGLKASALLMENDQGMYKVNKYLCATCLCEMSMEIPERTTCGGTKEKASYVFNVGRLYTANIFKRLYLRYRNKRRGV